MQSTITVSAGKVPGGVQDVTMPEGTTLLQAVNEASRIEGEIRGLGRNAFEIVIGDYELKGENVIDIPQVNGEFRADYDPVERRWSNVRWEDICEESDIVLVIPKVQGAQFVVTINMDQWEEPRKVGIYDPGDAEGGPQAGTVAQALHAAGIKLSDGDRVTLWDDNVELTHVLEEGDELYVHAAEVVYATPDIPAANSFEPSEDDVYAVPGTDVDELKSSAIQMRENADAAELKIQELLEQIKTFRASAAAHDAKAEEIGHTRADYTVARNRLIKLGVITQYTKDELEPMKRPDLRAILQGYGLKPKATAGKADLIRDILLVQQVA